MSDVTPAPAPAPVVTDTDQGPIDNSLEGLTDKQIQRLNDLEQMNNNTEVIQAEMAKLQAEGKINDLWFKSLMALLDRIEDSALR